MKKWQIFSMLTAVYLLFSVSCSTTTMKTVWKDKNYQDGKLQRIFVIRVSKNPTIRRVFEDEFAAQLKAVEEMTCKMKSNWNTTLKISSVRAKR